MTENVKFIFKTLLRVPIIILVSFAVLNIFAFGLSYFKLLGVAYVTMQAAIENNYLPPQEWNTLENYLLAQETSMLDSVTLACITGDEALTVDPRSVSGLSQAGNIRRQYGKPLTIVVGAHYRFVWPLMPSEQTSNGVAAKGYSVQGGYDTGLYKGRDLSESELRMAREEYEANPDNNIIITYTVPGLKYYPDLS